MRHMHKKGVQLFVLHQNLFIMADVNVFILGATGYIGAAVLDLLYAKHPEYRFTALVRSTAAGKELLDRYPLLRPVMGDLENAKLIETESENANIVISMLSKDVL